MRAVLLSLLFLFHSVAVADSKTARQGENWARISDEECPISVLEKWVSVHADKELKRAEVEFGGVKYAACWFMINPEFVWLVYEDGDQGAIPLTEFKEAI